MAKDLYEEPEGYEPPKSAGELIERYKAGERYFEGVSLIAVGTFGDLSDVDLSGANLSGAALSYANLRGARLYKVDLRGAKLDGADLSGAYLVSANLSGAKLDHAKLYAAEIGGANRLDFDGLPEGAS